MLVLGIETSCDETAAAVVSDDRRILADCVLSQIEQHRPYGGVVPEIAARNHVEQIDGMIERAVSEAGIAYADLDGIAATAGPGLIGGVLLAGPDLGRTLAARIHLSISPLHARHACMALAALMIFYFAQIVHSRAYVWTTAASMIFSCL